MQYKLQSTFLKRSIKILALWVAMSSSAAGAATNFKPVRSNGNEILNTTNGFSYYPTTGQSGSTTAFLDSGSSSVVENLLDLSATQQAPGTGNNQILFSITTDKTLTVSSGQTAAVVMSVFNSGSGTQVAIPIATTNYQSTCSGCQGAVSLSGVTYYTAARFTPGQALVVGLYPQDVCTVASQTGSVAGCGAGGVPNTNSSAGLTISVYVVVLNNLTDGLTTFSTADAQIKPIFVSTSGTLSCPTDFTDIYYPGDGQIFLNADRITLATGTAPRIGLAVAARDNAAVVDGPTWESSGSNNPTRRVGITAEEPVSGFTNSTATDDHPYQLAFMVKDAAGMIVYSGCTYPATPQVRTSAIYGFLKQGRCFIATASHGTHESPGVRTLRRFRDEVLLKSVPGQAFVNWYYGWSPGAAEWLIEHPVARVPVLMILAPIQLIAWLSLHPQWMLALVILNALIWFRFRRGWGDEAI